MEPSLVETKTMEPSSEAATVSLPEKSSPAPSQDAGSSADDELLQTTTDMSKVSEVTTKTVTEPNISMSSTTNKHLVNDAKDIGIVTEYPSTAEFDTTTVIATSNSTPEAIVYYNSDTFRYRQ